MEYYFIHLLYMIIILACIIFVYLFRNITFGRKIPKPPEHLRPPMPPVISKESMRLSFENSEKARICLEKMKSNLKK